MAAAIDLRAAPHDVIALARDSNGVVDLTRLAHGILAVWEHPEHGRRLVGFARRLTARGCSADSIGEYIQRSVFQPLVDHGREHARRIAVGIVGFLVGRYVLALPMFASLRREDAGRLLITMIR